MGYSKYINMEDFGLGAIEDLLAWKKKTGRNKFKHDTLKKIFPKTYYRYSSLPVEEDKVVFVEYRKSELLNSFHVLFDRLAGDYDFRIHTHFLLDGTAKRAEYTERSNEMMKDIATAKYLFVSEASTVISSVDLRPETVMVQLWHGCGAFKKFGFSTAELIFGPDREAMLKYPQYKNYTYVTVSSSEVSWAYKEAMNLPDEKTIVPTGLSRTDIFYDDHFHKEAFMTLHEVMPSSKGKKVILYAPTYRGRVKSASTPSMLSIEMFHEAFGDEYVLLFKHHPMVKSKKKPKIPQQYNDFARDVTEVMSIEELICVADVCISDYSSLIFEYSLLERPLVFFAYDLDEYFDWRGFYYDYDELTPGPVCTTNLEMIDYIKHIDERFDREQIRAFREKFVRNCDGHATERIMELAFGDALEKHKRKNPHKGVYHDIPKAFPTATEKEKELGIIRWWANEGDHIYEAKVYDNPVEEKKITLISSPETKVLMNYVKKRLSGKNNGFDVTILDETSSKGELLAEEMAKSAFVILAHRSFAVPALKIRRETRVIQLWDTAFSFERTDYAGREVIGGLKNDYLRISPLHANYSLVPVGSDMAGKNLSGSFGMAYDENIFDHNIGSISTDLLLDQKFCENSKQKILDLFEKDEEKRPIGERKIIYYDPTIRKDRTGGEGNILPDINLMNEYLKDEYFLICDVPMDDEEAEKAIPNYQYLKGFVSILPTGISPMEAMAASTVMVSDYGRHISTYAATIKPILLYVPDLVFYEKNPDYEEGIKDILPGEKFFETKALIERLLDLEKYAPSSQDGFREKFLKSCDGKSLKRLIEKMKNKEEK